MCHQSNRRTYNYPLGTTCALVIHQTLVFLLLTHCGQAEMIGSSTPILALIGEDVVLPCRLQPATDVGSLTLEWARFDLNPRFVHMRRDGREFLFNQNPSYLGRTSLSNEKLKYGDMSLTLSKVKLSDEGKYRCHIPDQGTLMVELVVGAVSSPVIIIKEIANQEVVFQCESKGWFPEPEVLWLDNEGNRVSAGPTESVRGLDGLFTVSSRLTVEKRKSNSFTCRVQQKNITQTRETGIQFQGDLCVAPSGPATGIIVVLVIGFLFVFVVFFVLWRLRQNRGDNKMHLDKATPKGREEEEQLVKGSQTTKDLDHEKLEEKEEEKNVIQHVILVLEEKKKELESSKLKLILELKNAVEERRENERKLKSVQTSYVWDRENKESSLLESTNKLENKVTNYKIILEKNEMKILKSTYIISKMEDRKKKVENQIDEIQKALKSGENEIQLQEVKDSLQEQKPTETSPLLEPNIEMENEKTDLLDSPEPESSKGKKSKQKKLEEERGEKKMQLQKVKDKFSRNKDNKTNPHLGSNIDLENKTTEHKNPLDSSDNKEQESMEMVTEPEGASVEPNSKKETLEDEKGENKTKFLEEKDSFQGDKPDKTTPRIEFETEGENQETEHEKLFDGTDTNKLETMEIVSVPEEQATEPESSKGQKSKQKKEKEKVAKEKGEKRTKLQKFKDRLSSINFIETNPQSESKAEMENEKMEDQEEPQSEQSVREETPQETESIKKTESHYL